MAENQNENTENLEAKKAADDAAAKKAAENKGAASEDSVSRSEFNKMLDELHKHKKEAKDLKAKDEATRAQKLKDEAKWQELAEANEKKALEAEEKAERVQSSYLGDKKFLAIQAECQKLGIRAEAVSDLEGLDFNELQVETTSTGKINILGASKFAQRLKTTKPHWFQDGKTSKINTGGNRVIENDDGPVTAESLYAAEKEGIKTGDKTKYYELHKKFQQQQSAARRH